MSLEARVARHAESALGRLVEIVGLAVLAYVPFLASAPGKVAADTKQALYLDPGRYLARAPYLWDPHVGAGTVPHQQVGFLFPMGPYYWLMDAIGVPDWVAQRLWLGTISFAAVLGARWLFRRLGCGRVGALAGALVYMLTPYQLAFTARISVLLLPWAVLPWVLGLTMRAVREGGWRDPAIVALLVMASGSVNASALLLVSIAPILWLLLEAFHGRDALVAVVKTSVRIGVLAVAASIWWVVGLRLQGAYGLPVLQLTENVKTVASASTPSDILRGLGNWFFYGRDRVGFSIVQADDYLHDTLTVAASFAIPAAGLVAALLVRWRHRAYFALLVVVGTVIGVGAWPFDDPSAYGRVWKSIASSWSPALALRNTPRVVPIIVLGLAGFLAALVAALRARSRWLQLGTVAVVGLVALAALAPVWRHGYLSEGVERPSDIPQYWIDATDALQSGDHANRILELPGSSFAAYRWGNTVEPVTPSLVDRPYVAREVLPYGTPPSVSLLDALDRRLQQGTFEATSLAPVARLLGVGTVALRSDLAYERQGTPRPRVVWAEIGQPRAPGLQAPQTFGPARPNVAPGQPLDPTELTTPTTATDPPPVALFDVKGAVPIVRTAPVEQPVVMSGDGDGVVDAAAAGLLDGDQMVLMMPALDRAELERALDHGADFVLTDTNRRRYRNFFSSIKDTAGPTERAGQSTKDPNDYQFRLAVFPGSTDASRTVVEQLGGTVDATGDGGAARPEDRPVHAFDGDVRTSWRVGGADPTKHHITVVADEPVQTDHVTLVQPLDGPRDRVLTKVRLRFDDGSSVVAGLGPDSFTETGQVVSFPARAVKRLEIDLLQTSTPPFDPALANAVGFAEVRLGNLRVTETVRLPVDLAQRVDGDARGHAVAVVMTRLRSDPTDVAHQDEELALDRTFELPDPRSYTLTGTARVNPNASDDVLDTALGTKVPGVTFSASSHLPDVDARASRAFDFDSTTAWTAAVAPQEGQWLDARLSDRPVTADRASFTVVADGRHSVPTQLRLEADGAPAQTIPVPPITDGKPGDRRTVALTFDPITTKHLRIVVTHVRHPVVDGKESGNAPVSIADVGIVGIPSPPPANAMPRTCRDDLLTLDGEPLPVSVAGTIANARRGLEVETCDPLPALHAGDHQLVARPGLDTAIDLDRLVLTSNRAGEPAPVAPLGANLATSGATVDVTHNGATALDVKVQTDGRPFWLVFGESHNDGWHASASSGDVGPLQLADGFANGWLVQPDGAGTMTIELRWQPQRLVWAGFVVSGVAILACVAFVLIGRRPGAGASTAFADRPALVDLLVYRDGAAPAWVTTALLAVGLGVVAALVSRPWVGGLTALATVVVARVPRARPLVIVAAPVLLVLSRALEEPELAWAALALLAVDVVIAAVRSRSAGHPPVPLAPRAD